MDKTGNLVYLAICFCICYSAVKQKEVSIRLHQNKTPTAATVGVSSLFMAEQTKAGRYHSFRLGDYTCQYGKRKGNLQKFCMEVLSIWIKSEKAKQKGR